MKLISLSDFVRIAEYPNNHEEAQSELVLIENFYNKVTQYNSFLKQSLELWMFVPCDENGEVLEEPKGHDEWYFNILSYPDCITGFAENRKYQQAKKRCLFEGFVLGEDGNRFFTAHFLHDEGSEVFWFSKDESIEDLLVFDHEFELTPTAIKQLGL